jgi:hypothetical protein
LSRVVSNYQFALSDPSDANIVADAAGGGDISEEVEYECHFFELLYQLVFLVASYIKQVLWKLPFNFIVV